LGRKERRKHTVLKRKAKAISSYEYVDMAF